MSTPQRDYRRQPAFKTDVSLDEIRKVSNFRQAFWWLYKTGIQRGSSTGWPTLDPYYTVRPREWTLLTGIPSHGKSSFLDNVMVNMSHLHGWKWAIFSAENLPFERHAAGLASLFAGRPFDPGPRTRMSESDFKWAEAFLQVHFSWINPPEDDCTVDRILHIAGMMADHEGIQGLVIDPWNELDHSRPGNMNETEYVSRALTKIRRFAREREVHVFLVAHPTKLQRIKNADTEANIYPVPTPYDVSGSAHFRNKADNCLCVWRDVANPHTATQVHVQKVRFREIGKVGVGELHYDAPTGQFMDPVIGPVFKPFDANQRIQERMGYANDREARKKELAELQTDPPPMIEKRSREPGDDDE
jgi:twinkle protein